MEKYLTIFDIQSELVRSLSTDGSTVAVTRRFATLLNNVQRVDFVCELIEKYNLCPQFIKDHKNDETARLYREQGNQMFRIKKDSEALNLYTKSISFSEHFSENLALAFANRAAVLFELRMYRECLADIDRAFFNNYPEKLKDKLLSRQRRARDLLPMQNIESYYENIPEIPEQHKNPFIQCASDSIQIVSDPYQGRHVVATRDISIGEVIAVEQPAFTILLEHRLTHCHECLRLCYNLIPCDNCTQALFCSPDCKTKAVIAYHKYECPILLTIHQLKLDKLKILPLKIAVRVRDQYKQLDNYQLNPAEVYQSGRYKEIHNLVSNSEKRSVSDLFERTITAAVIYDLVLKYTNFFMTLEKEYMQQIFKQLVLLHLQTSACNFHEITELGEVSGIYVPDELGAGAYSFLSLLNHSCSPNVARNSHGTTVVLRAVETIKKGEQVYENYGYHYAVMSAAERKAKLRKQYFFDCSCVACQNNWSSYQSLPTINVNMDLLTLNLPEMCNGSREAAKRVELQAIVQVRELELYKPCKNFGEMQELLKQCYSIYGNKRRTLGTQ